MARPLLSSASESGVAALPQKSGSDRLGASPAVVQFLKAITPVVSQYETRFESSRFSSAPITSISDAVHVLKTALHDAKAKADLQAFTKRLGGTQSEALWNEYFSAYDKTVGFCDGYLEMTLAAAKAISKKGHILDIGAGTGNYSAQLLHGSRLRSVTAIDLSTNGLKMAREKARVFAEGELSRFQAKVANLRMGLHGLGQTYDGAVMSNVLYSIPANERKKMLKQVFQVLNPGAEFVIIDPVPTIQKDEAALERFLTRIMVDAVLNGAELKATEIALIAHVNAQALVGEAPAYLTTRELSDGLLAAGFQIYERREAYYGMCSFISARRPILARRK